MVKNPPAKAGYARDTGSITGSERSPGGRNGNPLQYSCLENSMDIRSLAGYSPWGYGESDTTEHARAHMCTHVRARAHTHTHTHPSRKKKFLSSFLSFK